MKTVLQLLLLLGLCAGASLLTSCGSGSIPELDSTPYRSNEGIGNAFSPAVSLY